MIVRNHLAPGRKPAFFFIEVKAPESFDSDKSFIEGQLFELALLEAKNGLVKYLVYYSIDTLLQDRLIIIDYSKYTNYEAWQEAGGITLDRLPRDYGEAVKSRYVNLRANATPDELARPLNRRTNADAFVALRKRLHNVLWGGGSMSYNDIFSNLIKLFLVKIYDEETTRPGAAYGFQIQFRGDEPESPEQVFRRINDLYNECRKEYLGYSDEEVRESVGIDREKVSPSKVAYVVENLQGISLRQNEYGAEADLLGAFFEGIVSDGFKQDKGQFFTHHNIVKFMITAVELVGFARDLVNGFETLAKPRLPYICDPSCGSGTFLISAMKAVSSELQKIKATQELHYKTQEFMASNCPAFTPNVWAKEFIYGVEPHADLAMATKVNMVLHGDGNINVFRKSGLLAFSSYSTRERTSALAAFRHVDLGELRGVFPRIEHYEVNERFDAVITNPPFSITLDQDTQRTLPGRFLLAQKGNSEALFVERWFQLLRHGGRVAAIMPDSFFDNKDDLDVRIFIYRFFELKAVVSLPMLAFVPFTPTKTSILFAQKKSNEDVLIFDRTWNSFYDTARPFVDRLRSWKFIGKIDAETESAIRYCLSPFVDPSEFSITSIAKIVETYRSTLNECISNLQWLLFAKTTAEIGNAQFAIAHAEQIGFKRSKRKGEMPRPNELFEDDGGLPTLPVHENYPRIDDFLRDTVKW
jgi:type I restriction enzyme M protein